MLNAFGDAVLAKAWRAAAPALMMTALLCGPGAAQSAKPAPRPAAQPQAPAQPQPAAPPAALPPVSADPATTSATYGDWVLRCQSVGDADKVQRLCEVSQSITAQNQREPVAEVALGRLAGDPALRLTVALPSNVSFPSTVDLASLASGGPVAHLQWHRCIPGGCFADGVPAEDTMRAFRSTTGPGKLVFKDALGREVTLPLSFRGLAQALDALPKS